jgi:hypothetical protein
MRKSGIVNKGDWCIMNIEEIRDAIRSGVPMEYSVHCQKRMLERDISRNDIKNAVFVGEIIENYPLEGEHVSEESLPSCLVLGVKSSDDKKIHVVLGFNGRKILFISVYYPDLFHWNDDCKTRRNG